MKKLVLILFMPTFLLSSCSSYRKSSREILKSGKRSISDVHFPNNVNITSESNFHDFSEHCSSSKPFRELMKDTFIGKEDAPWQIEAIEAKAVDLNPCGGTGVISLTILSLGLWPVYQRHKIDVTVRMINRHTKLKKQFPINLEAGEGYGWWYFFKGNSSSDWYSESKDPFNDSNYFKRGMAEAIYSAQ